MNEQQRAVVQQALEAINEELAVDMTDMDAVDRAAEMLCKASTALCKLLEQPEPIISLQCAHCQSTIESLETQVVALRTVLETERGFAQQERATTPLTKNQIDLLINGRGDEGDDDYVEPTGDGFGVREQDLITLVRRVENLHGIEVKP